MGDAVELYRKSMIRDEWDTAKGRRFFDTDDRFPSAVTHDALWGQVELDRGNFWAPSESVRKQRLRELDERPGLWGVTDTLEKFRGRWGDG